MVIMFDKRGEYYDELETMPAQVRQQYAEKKLRQTVVHAYNHSSASKAIFDRAGVKPEDIKTIKDLEKLPVTRKTDLIEWQKQNPPFGGLVTIPLEGIDRVFISPGPVYEIQSPDVQWFARALWSAGFRKGDRALNTFTYHMSPAGILLHEAIRDCGATVVVAGTGNTDIQLQNMRDLGVNCFVGTPTFLMTLIKRAEELKTDFKLERAWFTGEMLNAATRQTLEQTYHIATSQAYAVTEPGGAIAYECREHNGMHLMDDYIMEIVDPQSGRQLGTGEVGEVVVTPVHHPAWGLIRFGTGDLSSVSDEPCRCGRTANRLLGIVGRSADAVKIRGMFVVAKQAEQVVLGFEAVSDFQIVVRREGQRDEAVLKLELKDESVDKTRLASDLSEKFQSLCRVKPDKIAFVAKGSIPEGAKKLVDERSWK
jgi:phenylacetate-CoA ligase